MAGYCFQDFIIGGLGSLLGVLLGVTFLHFKDKIVSTLAVLTGSEAILERFYTFTALPVSYSASNFFAIIASALVLSTLASVLPALIAGRKNPATALRSEA